MLSEVFILSLALFFIFYLAWGFKNLAREKWQIMLSRPLKKQGNGSWLGENLTYYGFFSANAYLLSVSIYLILLGSIHVPFAVSFGVCAMILMVCVPASRFVAWLVEGKQATLTVGGSVFVGTVIAPGVIALVGNVAENSIAYNLPIVAILAAISVAYAFGEGAGRLACISFGCCYGKPLKDSNHFFKKLFGTWHFVFHGEIKKASYEGNMEGVALLPIQAVTSITYIFTGLVGAYLFLKGYYVTSFLESLIITQGWRMVSEVFRADFRGHMKFSAYQIMSALSVAYSFLLVSIIQSTKNIPADILAGLTVLWDPIVIVLLQGIWLGTFLFTGKSMVTGAHLKFHVIKDKI